MIPTTRISARAIPTLPTLVPEHLDRNPWILYHATTSALSQAIERDGFIGREDTAMPAAIRKLLTIYHSIGWHGVSTAGYAVLRGFSFIRNHTSSERPVYFTAYAHRSPLYAQPDFAGGETARGIRHAYRDLVRYLNEPALREEHLEQARAECIELVKKDGIPIRVVTANLEWMQTRLDELTDVYRRLDALERSGMPGVIYAVEFTPDDLPHIVYRWSCGAAVYRAIPADRIRHKVEILDAEEIDAWTDGHRSLREMWRDEAPNGLLAQLAAHGGKKLGDEEWENAQQTLDALIDRAGGTDEGMDLAERYGSPAVKAWVAQKRSAALQAK